MQGATDAMAAGAAAGHARAESHEEAAEETDCGTERDGSVTEAFFPERGQPAVGQFAAVGSGEEGAEDRARDEDEFPIEFRGVIAVIFQAPGELGNEGFAEDTSG